MAYIVGVGERQITISTEANGHERAVVLDGRALHVDWQPLGGSALPPDAPRRVSALIGTRSYEAIIRPLTPQEQGDGAGRGFEVTIAGRPYRVQVQDERTRELASLAGGAHGAGDATIRAPMPGLVSNVLAAEGAAVERGQAVVVLEAMKMENDLATPRAGVVKALHVTRGQTVNQGDILAIIGDPPGTAEAPTEDEVVGE